MSIEAARLYATIQVDGADKATDSLRNVGSQADKAQNELKQVSSVSGNLKGPLGQAAAGAQGVAGAFGGVGGAAQSANQSVTAMWGALGNVKKKAEEVQKPLVDFSGVVKDANRGMADAVQQMTGVSLASIGVTAGIMAAGAAFSYAAAEAMEAERAQRQLNAVLQSTKGIAGVTADEVDDMASEMMRLSGVDDDVIKKNAAVMLTFTRVGQEVFPQAMQAALDMSVALDQDLKSAIMSVGFAMNDPVEGASKLRRSGVMLSDQQEELIKKFMAVNDVAAAQKVLLDELATEFGGQATTMGQSFDGLMNRFKANMGNFAASTFAPVLEVGRDALKAANEILEFQGRVTKALKEEDYQAQLTSSSYGEYLEKRTAALVAAGKLSERARQQLIADPQKLASMKAAIEVNPGILGTPYMKEWAGVVDISNEYMANLVQTTSEFYQAQIRQAAATNYATDAAEANGRALALQKQASEETQAAIKKYAAEVSSAQSAVDEYTRLVNGVQAAEERASEGLAGKFQSSFEKYVGEWSPKFRDFLKMKDEVFGTETLKEFDLGKEIDASVLKAVQTGNWEALRQKMVEVRQRGIDEIHNGMLPVIARISELRERIEAIPKDVWVKVHIESDQVPDFSGLGNSNPNVKTFKPTSSGDAAMFGGFKAAGGPVEAMRPYVVGEQGPELFVPNRSGTIIPNKRVGGVTINLYATVNNEVDEEILVHKIARRLQGAY